MVTRRQIVGWTIVLFIVLAMAMEGKIQRHSSHAAQQQPPPVQVAQPQAAIDILPPPFYNPARYVGMSILQAAKASGGTPNKVNNIVIDSEVAHLLLETKPEDGRKFISYAEVEVKQTAPCSIYRAFESEPVLRAIGINPSELQLVRKQTHFHTYYDHARKLKIGVSCSGLEDEGLVVGLSSTYYGQ